MRGILSAFMSSVALCVACEKNRATWRGFCESCRRRMGPAAVRAIEKDAREFGGAFKMRSKVVARLQMTFASVKAFGGGRRS